MRRSAAALAVGAAAFWLYHATLLPGFDFGDTGSFQTSAGYALIRGRDAYPLYFAVGQLFLWLLPGDPAHALNLASAVQASLACALIVLAAEELTGSLVAAVAAAVIFAGSYTFWSQAIIAEVYALHAAFVAGTLFLLLRWQRHPSTGRLTAFFAVYALGFGNHLSMILLAPAYTAFLFSAAPDGWRSLLTPRVVGLAVLCACLGAAQYLWNFAAIWYSPQPPSGIPDALARFWFDVTKTDWRGTTVLSVPASMVPDRLRMYWFDIRQQFGPVVPALAAFGLAWLFRTAWQRAILVALVYVATALFAFSYNVGDTHVFYLTSHLCVALLAGACVPAVRTATGRPRLAIAAALIMLGYGGVRVYRDYPAIDRSGDRRPAEIMTSLTAGLEDRRALLLTDMHWQIENGLSYFAKNVRPALEYARMPDVLLYAPVLIANNLSIGREVAATSRARVEIMAAYGPIVSAEPDGRAPAPTLRDLTSRLAPGTPYVLCVLKPMREFSVDAGEVNEAIGMLSGASVRGLPPGQYAIVAGRIGEAPVLVEASDDPFTRDVNLAGVPTQVRMESWLAADTIRRMGFGHVIAARRHVLIVERGVSFVAFDEEARVVRRGYDGNIFAPQSRYLIKIARGMVDR